MLFHIGGEAHRLPGIVIVTIIIEAGVVLEPPEGVVRKQERDDDQHGLAERPGQKAGDRQGESPSDLDTFELYLAAQTLHLTGTPPMSDGCAMSVTVDTQSARSGAASQRQRQRQSRAKGECHRPACSARTPQEPVRWGAQNERGSSPQQDGYDGGIRHRTLKSRLEQGTHHVPSMEPTVTDPTKRATTAREAFSKLARLLHWCLMLEFSDCRRLPIAWPQERPFHFHFVKPSARIARSNLCAGYFPSGNETLWFSPIFSTSTLVSV